MIEHSRTRWSCATIAAWLLAAAPYGLAHAQGVGATSARVGAVGAGSRATATAPAVGAKLREAQPPVVSLLDNERNPCLDGAGDCRLYWIAQDAADPDIVYDGRSMVQYPTELDVVMVPENDPDLLDCRLTRSVKWPDLVERGRTVAGLKDMGKLFELAQETVRPGRAAATRYRLVWCPSSGANGARTDLNARGQSWRLIVLPRGSTLVPTPTPTPK